MGREMKDSGFDWIGVIPQHWDLKRLRYLGTLQNGISKGSEYFGFGYPFISYGDVYRNIQLPLIGSGLIDSNNTERDTYSVRIGDVLFTRTSETIEEVGYASTCLMTIDNAVFAGFLIRFRPFIDELNVSFSKYYFRCEMHRGFFVKEMNLVTRASLSQELLKKLPVIIPTKEEQKQIAKYLDKKCTEIDDIIYRTILSIEEYKKYKQSITTEALTKGLNPETEMKESGIQWIEKLPKNWEVRPLKYILKERNQKNFPITTEERLSLSIDKGVTLFSEKTTNKDRIKDDVSEYKVAYPNDIVINSMNVIVGAVGISKYLGCVSPVYYVLYSDNEDYLIEYYDYLFKIPVLQKYLKGLGNGISAIQTENKLNTVRLRIPMEKLGRLNFPVPSKEEQKEIVKYLNEKIKKINNLITKKEQLVEALEAYKKSLIYEVVTGKREVN